VYLGLSRLMDERVEGFGISLVEASACALPVVAGKSGGVSEAVKDGVTGLLVDPGEPAQIGAALRRLLEDRELRLRLGASGRRAVESYYNWNRVASDIEDLAQEFRGQAAESSGRTLMA
jgi:phosphatidylinositol alpha-1,6-mannosyltransferase